MHGRADLAPAVVHGWQEHVFQTANDQEGLVLVGCENFVQGTFTTQVLAVTTPLNSPPDSRGSAAFEIKRISPLGRRIACSPAMPSALLLYESLQAAVISHGQ